MASEPMRPTAQRRHGARAGGNRPCVVSSTCARLGSAGIVGAVALVLLVGCGAGAAGAAGTAAYAGAQAVAAAARRASGGCYTPCTHDTHCDHSTGLCEPGPPEASRAASAPRRTSGGHARHAITSEAASDYDCALPDGEREVVQAHSRTGARDVCLAWNDVGDAEGACACEPVPVVP